MDISCLLGILLGSAVIVLVIGFVGDAKGWWSL